MKKLTAEQAKEIVETKGKEYKERLAVKAEEQLKKEHEVFLAHAYSKIEIAAKKGETCVKVGSQTLTWDFDIKAVELAREDLKGSGYEVFNRHSELSMYKEGYGHTNVDVLILEISWAKNKFDCFYT